MYRTLAIVMTLSGCACASPVREEPSPAIEIRTQLVRDPELERQVTQLEIQLMERDARIERLNAQLEQALKELVGTMGKLRSLATRAEAASAMAEADVALKSTRNSSQNSTESKQAAWLMQQSAAEFQQKNFGGALYLANQARAAARLRGSGAGVDQPRPGEVAFGAPVKLRARSNANVRSGPGMSFAVSYSADSGSALSGLSHVGEWIRVTNAAGNEGWIFGSLVSRGEDQNH
jgi:uncharacterized coiled-coil protein SlyX